MLKLRLFMRAGVLHPEIEPGILRGRTAQCADLIIPRFLQRGQLTGFSGFSGGLSLKSLSDWRSLGTDSSCFAGPSTFSWLRTCIHDSCCSRELSVVMKDEDVGGAGNPRLRKTESRLGSDR